MSRLSADSIGMLLLKKNKKQKKKQRHKKSAVSYQDFIGCSCIEMSRAMMQRQRK